MIFVVIGLYGAGVVHARYDLCEYPELATILSCPSSQSGESQLSLAEGSRLYTRACASCHGTQGEGIDSLGSSLVGSPFMSELTDDELLALIRDGRPADAVDNRSGVAMPPRGGQTDLSDEQIVEIIRYLRSEFGDETAQR